MKKRLSLRLIALALLLCLLFSLTVACGVTDEGDGKEVDTGTPVCIEIQGDESFTMKVGEGRRLIVSLSGEGKVTYFSSSPAVSVNADGLLSADAEGKATVTAVLGSATDSVTVTVIADDSLNGDDGGGNTDAEDNNDSDGGEGDGADNGDTDGKEDGSDTENGGSDGNENSEFDTDPYVNMTKAEFYADYSPAVSYLDAYYRSLHGFMSGSIEEQNQAPTLSSHRPKIEGCFVRNSEMLYGEDGNAYYIVDSYGNTVGAVYRGGAYVTLEEVAAYIYAFGDIPANYTAAKKGSPSSSIWGVYLRLNHTNFSGDTEKYPYEPVLPNISGCGGRLKYKEVDIGTTGTDCDPSYPALPYNDGYGIERGAARIVYGKYDLNHNGIYDEGELYLFYTYNHYNDFCEYLNYLGGWGDTFGNITGGGSISSKYDYAPTPYVPVRSAPISSLGSEAALVTVIPALIFEECQYCSRKRQNIH